MDSIHKSKKRTLISQDSDIKPKIPKLDYESESSTVANEEESTQFHEDIKCSICSEILIKSVTLNCSHTFCKYCIDRWMSVQADCPICRTKIIYKVPTLTLDNVIDKIVDGLPKSSQRHRQLMISERNKKAISPKVSKHKNGWIKMRRMNGLSSYYMIPTYVNARRNFDQVTIMYFEQDHDPEWEDLGEDSDDESVDDSHDTAGN